MEINEIMSINSDNLLKMQYQALKEHTTGILKKIIELIENEQYDELGKHVDCNPDCSYYFIDFGYSINGETNTLDIIDAGNQLKRLKKQINCE
jgi:hypothetical protein